MRGSACRGSAPSRAESENLSVSLFGGQVGGEFRQTGHVFFGTLWLGLGFQGARRRIRAGCVSCPWGLGSGNLGWGSIVP
ncbi:hypothetical protein ACFX1S_044165 [Malus domestica]